MLRRGRINPRSLHDRGGAARQLSVSRVACRRDATRRYVVVGECGSAERRVALTIAQNDLTTIIAATMRGRFRPAPSAPNH